MTDADRQGRACSAAMRSAITFGPPTSVSPAMHAANAPDPGHDQPVGVDRLIGVRGNEHGRTGPRHRPLGRAKVA